MNRAVFDIPGFKGLSLIENRNHVQSADIKNFEVRESSLRTRNGADDKLSAKTNDFQSFFLLKTKAGVKYFLGCEGATDHVNIWVSKADFSDWETAALIATAKNAYFDSVCFNDKIYMGNGTDALMYDGGTLSSITGTPPAFNFITEYKNRIMTNDVTYPNYLRYSEVGVDAPATIGDNIFQTSEHDGDAFKSAIKILTHLFILNEFSCYSLYGYDADTFSKSIVAPIGTVSNRSVVNVNGAVFFLSHNGVYRYAGSGVELISFGLSKISDLIDSTRFQYSCACSYKDRYWLAVSKKGSTTNDIVLVYDTISEEWEIYEYPFNINDFCVDGTDLYVATNDNKIYLLDSGNMDGTTLIESTWESDALNLNYPGRKKRLKHVTVELSDIAVGGTINFYLKEDDGDYSDAYTINVPSTPPGRTVSTRVQTGKFYNLTFKLITTCKCQINRITFGDKVKNKVK